MGTETKPGFRDVDAHELAPQLVEYLLAVEQRCDMVRMHALAASYAAPPPGGTALDAGCGTGGAALRLAHDVGLQGTVFGVDASEAMLSVARSRVTGPASGPVRFEKGDITALPFPDEEFDFVRSERVLQHLVDPDRAVRELVRVCKPGGQVLLLDTDWTSFTCDLDDPDLVRAAIGPVLDHCASPASGLELRRRLIRAGCEDLVAVPYAFVMTSVEDAAGLIITFRRDLPPGAPVVPEELRERWFTAVDRAEAAGELLVTVTAWVAVGRKPG